jgi:hypothetical protein
VLSLLPQYGGAVGALDQVRECIADESHMLCEIARVLIDDQCRGHCDRDACR